MDVTSLEVPKNTQEESAATSNSPDEIIPEHEPSMSTALSLYYILLYLSAFVGIISILARFDQPWIRLHLKKAPFPPPGMTQGPIRICPTRLPDARPGCFTVTGYSYWAHIQRDLLHKSHLQLDDGD
ncbi:hypothetical protein BKA63DRAFT_559939 [Paraphoma chrysanthemicola]|nr:hypothetical protein BKA63DRAFT_559939 [Paraphoma chrysanthemicola]